MHDTKKCNVLLRRCAPFVVVGVIAATIWGPTGRAYAGVGSQRPASFCGAAEKLGEQIYRPDADPSGEAFEKVLKSVRRLSKQSPDALESSFEALLGFYDLLEADPDDAQRIIDEGRRAAKAGRRIAKYLKNRCNVDVND